jgi:hypothetical protein
MPRARPVLVLTVFVVTVLVLALAGAAPARAGGGPERTVVVVNADSPASLWVAHAYAKRRAIPPSHLIYLEGAPTLRIVDVETFRERLWGPVKRQLEERGLLETTDLLVWSVDFPFAVDVAAEAKAKGFQGMAHVPLRASLTSLTYFWRLVEAKEPARYLDLGANRYAQLDPALRGGGRRGRTLTSAEASLVRVAEQALQKRDHAAARDAYLELLRTGPDLMDAWYNLACCYARLGQADDALKALANAVTHGWTDSAHTLNDPDLESLRRKPEFDALLTRMEREVGNRGKDLDSKGFRAAQDGTLMSVMLGFTGEWGNSLPEVLACLERGAASDGTNPNGTVYLLANDDVRANTREPFFPFTVELLKALGRKAVVLTKGEDGQDGIVPKGKPDVIGAVLGSAGLAWKGSESTMLPGAIAEHLTSHGADFDHGGQTKISELLRSGAAGSSGTVAEPLSIWAKFPLPSIHAHYARGCSLAEAFYQSLAGPWQTLVVGDALARPFARFERLELRAPAEDAVLLGGAAVEVEGGAGGQALELWVDGNLRASAAAGKALQWDTSREDDGVHELRVVHVAGDAIETRSHVIAWRTVGNATRTVTLVGPKAPPAWGEPWVLTGRVLAGEKPVDAVGVDLLLGARVVATAPVKAGAFKLEVDSRVLGPAPVGLVARARFAEGPAARSAPLEVAPAPEAPPAKKGSNVKPPAKPRKPKDGKGDAPAAAPATQGLVLRVTDEKKKVHEGTLAALTDEALTKALADLKLPQPASLEITGQIEVPADGFYQLILTTSGALDVNWAGQRALDVPEATPARLNFAAAHLRAGWTPLTLRLVPKGTPRLTALLGGQTVTAPIAPARFKP